MGDAASRCLDAGVVPTEVVVTCVFHVVNDTGSAVAIKRVSASCGCTSAEMSKLAIKPGEIADLLARISTDRDAGVKEVSIRVDGAVGGKPMRFDFVAKMEIAPVLGFQTDKLQLDIGTINVGNGPFRHDLFVARGPNPARWNGVLAVSDNPQLTSITEPPGRGKLAVRLAIDAQRRIGPFAANLRFHVLNDGVDTGYSVSRRVTATVVGPVRAAPSSWLIGEAVPGRVAEQSIHIVPTGSDDEQAEFLDATASDPKAFEIVKNATHKDRFAIRYKPPATLGRDSGYVDVSVSTRHGNYTIRIFYMALVVAPEPPAAGPTPTLAPIKESDDADASP